MASVADCEKALQALAERLAAKNGAGAHAGFERSLSCTLRDPQAVYLGRLHGGQLVDIRPGSAAEAQAAQVRLSMTGDDLLALVDGSLNLASAWAGGRVKVGAGVRDLIRLRSIF